ncbi:hypothetical protein [Tahibacter aquaticus]|uniref:hypothetical protein n=1 Tax=Tahibacter aquaticus TaxID=520092 RepID=UPI001060DDCD|nr:hypothetical protein [Tahibacter aquaticus]
MLGPIAAHGAAFPPHANASPARPTYAEAGDGELHIRFNHELLAQLGLQALQADGRSVATEGLAIPLSSLGKTRLELQGAGLRAWQGGELRAAAGFVLADGDGTTRLDFRTLSLIPRRGSTELDFSGATTAARLRADSVMAIRASDAAALQVLSLDLRLAPEAAAELGQPGWAGLTIADAQLSLKLTRPSPAGESSCAVPNWPGSGDGAYAADLQLDGITAQMMRCGEPGCSGNACTCDGPGGTDAAVVIAPAAELSNPDDDNGGLPCTAADPCSADLPWNARFSPPRPPHGNDQHPLLIWNLYRLDADGGISQIGRSGVKHAFVALNSQCACADAQILGRGCSDTYASNNNDNNAALGARREVDPTQVRWGRCGSLDDDEVVPPNPDLGGCDGKRDASGNTVWSHRLSVRESQLDPAQHVGSRYLFEAWYLVRDDVNIYNSMGFIEVAPHWEGTWQLPPAPATAFRRGSALDAWAPPQAADPLQLVSSHRDARGQLRLATRVRDLGQGRWRYDYALVNFDYAQVQTAGSEPNLRVLGNAGLAAVSLPLPASTRVLASVFVDGDLLAGNDWNSHRLAQELRWQAVPGTSLDWGSLFRYSLIADAAPVSGTLQTWLDADAQQAGPALAALVPGAPGTGWIFSDAFEALLRGGTRTP